MHFLYMKFSALKLKKYPLGHTTDLNFMDKVTKKYVNGIYRNKKYITHKKIKLLGRIIA